MSVHVFRARYAEALAAHEIRMCLMAEDKRAVALRSGRNTRRDGRRLRHAARAISDANRHWVLAVVQLLTWGLS